MSSGRRGGRGANRRYRPLSEINVTPFVDVMLVLLIVFMVTAPLLTVGVPVDLPKTQAQSIADPDEPLVGGRLGIDSIDVLEMVMMVERDYGLTIDNKTLGAEVFASLRALAGYIARNAPEAAK